MRRYIDLLLIFTCGFVVCGIFAMLSGAQSMLDGGRQFALTELEKPSLTSPKTSDGVVRTVKKVLPCVVNIDTIARSAKLISTTSGQTSMVDHEVRGKGAGVILTSNGYIVTNNHVIRDTAKIRVTLQNGKWRYAEVVGIDPATDLAVIRIVAKNLPVAELGDSTQLEVGESVVALGNPLGLGSTVTTGIVSALNRKNLKVDELRTLQNVIQTDAPMNRGNSGGALADMNGRVIGINTAILSSSPGGGSIGLGFAIPSNTVRKVAKQLISNGRAASSKLATPWAGLSFITEDSRPLATLLHRTTSGIIIQKVEPSSPASRVGLKAGDVLMEIDGKEIATENDVREAIQQHEVGETALFKVRRSEATTVEEIVVTLTDRPF